VDQKAVGTKVLLQTGGRSLAMRLDSRGGSEEVGQLLWERRVFSGRSRVPGGMAPIWWREARPPHLAAMLGGGCGDPGVPPSVGRVSMRPSSRGEPGSTRDSQRHVCARFLPTGANLHLNRGLATKSIFVCQRSTGTCIDKSYTPAGGGFCLSLVGFGANGCREGEAYVSL
jgi:hypothetical protein